MNPFFAEGNRRAIAPEIAGLVEKSVGCTCVEGLDEMLDSGDAAVADDRHSGFAERHSRAEWLLGLSAGKGMRWRTSSVPSDRSDRTVFLLSIGFGNGSPLPQPSGRWDISVNGRFAVSVRMVNHSQLWRSGDCALAFSANRIETAEPYSSMCLSTLIRDEGVAAFGPALLCVPSSWLESGQPAEMAVHAVCKAPSTRWFQLGISAGLLQTADIWQAVQMLGPDPHPRAGDYRVFFGDIHTHSGQVGDECANRGCGRGSREDNYSFARGAGGLDFYSLTDHEWQVGPDGIADYLGMADQHNEDGRFVCLPGFEWTNLLYGHRNVYFRDSGGTVVSSYKEWGSPTLDPDRCTTPDDLWAAVEKTGIPFITVPHHSSSTSHPLNLDFYNPKYDRLFEVYSCWGSSEYYGDFPRGVSDRFRTGDFRDAVRRGQRYGLIASADGHDGHPGDAQSPLVKHHHLFHFCGSGRAAVLAAELTRASVFDALHARRCYATTGVPIVLDVRLNGALMGEHLPPLPPGTIPRISIHCQGTNGLDSIRIIKNAEVAHSIPCCCEFARSIEWEDEGYDCTVPNSYYVRVIQKDRESAWSSPIWVG